MEIPQALDAKQLLVSALDAAGRSPRWVVDADVPTVLVTASEWRPTGIDLAGFAFDAEHLLEACPAFPLARIVLTPPPAMTSVVSVGEGIEAVAGSLDRLSEDARAVADWLRRAMEFIESEVARVRSEGDACRRGITSSSLGAWHISSCNQHQRTLRVDGRDLKLSMGDATGTAEDLSTIYLWPLVRAHWRARYRPRFALVTADYGTQRIQIELGKGGDDMPRYWVDLGRGHCDRAVASGRLIRAATG